MSGIIEPIPGHPILSEVRELGGYTQRLYGAVEKLQPIFTADGFNVTLKNGQITCFSKVIILNEEGITGTAPTPSQSTSYYVYLVINMEEDSLSFQFSEVENPQGMRKDNLYADPHFGIHWMLVGEVICNTAGIEDAIFTMKNASDPEFVFDEGEATTGSVIDLKYTVEELQAVSDIIIDLDDPSVSLTGRVSPLSIIRCGGIYISTAPNTNAMCAVELRPVSNNPSEGTLYRVTAIRIVYNGNNNPGPNASISAVSIKW